MGAPLWLWFGYEAVICKCCCRRLTNFGKSTCWGVGISRAPAYGALITSNMNSVRYCQLMEFLTLSLSPTWLIHSSGGRLRAVELASYGSMPFTLGMDDASYRLIGELLGWANLVDPFVGWESHSLGFQVTILQDSYGIGIADDPVGLWLVYELGSPLGDLLDSDTWPPVGLQFIFYIPHGSKVRSPDLVVSPSQATLVVPHSISCPTCTPPPSGACFTSP